MPEKVAFRTKPTGPADAGAGAGNLGRSLRPTATCGSEIRAGRQEQREAVQRRTRDGDRCGRTGWRLGWSGWVRRSAGDGAKGPLYDWARVEIRPRGTGCWCGAASPSPGSSISASARLIRLWRNLRVAGTRWTIEDALRRPRERWVWQYEVLVPHITLAMLAHACLAVVRRRVGTRRSEGKGGSPSLDEKLIPLRCPRSGGCSTG